jgi:hypothetical protein
MKRENWRAAESNSARGFTGDVVGRGAARVKRANLVIDTVLEAGALGGEFGGFLEIGGDNGPITTDDLLGFTKGAVGDRAGFETGFGDDGDVCVEA